DTHTFPLAALSARFPASIRTSRTPSFERSLRFRSTIILRRKECCVSTSASVAIVNSGDNSNRAEFSLRLDIAMIPFRGFRRHRVHRSGSLAYAGEGASQADPRSGSLGTSNKLREV